MPRPNKRGTHRLDIQKQPRNRNLKKEPDDDKADRAHVADRDPVFRKRDSNEWYGNEADQALQVFKNLPKIRRILETLMDVGLGYIKLGQPATTLSGGEAQRIKLARELAKKGTGKTLYILDEPTTGLHFHDIKQLLEVLQRLVDAGNTVIIIEHNLDVIKTADWIIDLGPEGGYNGGRVVARGTPEKVAEQPASYTGRYLKALLRARA